LALDDAALVSGVLREPSSVEFLPHPERNHLGGCAQAASPRPTRSHPGLAVYSFVTGEYRSSSRFVPTSPKSIFATALDPPFSIATTRPIP